MTANAIQGDRDLCLNAGMSDYATKPVERDVLLKKIAGHLTAYRGATQSDAQSVTMLVKSDPLPMKPAPITTLQKATETPIVTAIAALASMDTVVDEVEIIRWDELLDRCSKNRDLALKILKKFHDRGPTEIDRLRNTLGTGDWESARMMAHTLKGTAGNISAIAVHQAAAGIESRLKSEPQKIGTQDLAELESKMQACLNRIEFLLTHE
ncbi:MAG: response regulator [Pirellulales bacterium]